MTDPRVEIRTYDSASDFIAALHPSKWREREWIFRGHADASWPLLPAALRDETWSTDGDWRTFSPYLPSKATEQQRCDLELRLLAAFEYYLDVAGLPVPSAPAFGYVRMAAQEAFGPASRLWDSKALAALAQHHGVPTRLLDFSERGFAAAYFAALPPSTPADELCVWAAPSSLGGGHLPDGYLRLVRAPRASNPNLHAQSGVFAFWSVDRPEVLTLDQVLLEAAKGQDLLLVKLVLPRKHATELLKLLRLEWVTGLSMFPGVDGVVRLLREHGREVDDP